MAINVNENGTLKTIGVKISGITGVEYIGSKQFSSVYNTAFTLPRRLGDYKYLITILACKTGASSADLFSGIVVISPQYLYDEKYSSNSGRKECMIKFGNNSNCVASCLITNLNQLEFSGFKMPNYASTQDLWGIY